MATSTRLRTADYRAVFKLVGECRELRVDSTLWRRHMLEELLRLTGGQVAMGGPALLSQGHLQPDPAPSIDLGWAGERERAAFFQFMGDQMHRQDPALTRFGRQVAKLRAPKNLLTRCRAQLSSDRHWYNSAAYCDYRRRAGTDDSLLSVVKLGVRRLHAIVLYRAPTERQFSARDRRLLHLFHEELMPHLDQELAPPGCDPVSSLSPRLRQILDCLLDGDSEKQVAARVGLTPRTVNQYIKSIYRRFRVSSRAELMARWIPTRR